MPETVPDEVLNELRAALERDKWINTHKYPVAVKIRDGNLVLEGTIEHVAAKRRAFALAQRILGDHCTVVDLLRRLPTEPMEDLEFRDAVAKSLSNESVFAEYTLRTDVGGEVQTLHDGGADAYEVVAQIKSGAVTLFGSTGSLTHLRLAEALIWWISGCETVDNQLKVIPEEDDTDNEITDAVRILLEKDPLVHASQLRVGTAGGIVHLDGFVNSDAEKKFAVLDAWCVQGIWDVMDRIEVRT